MPNDVKAILSVVAMIAGVFFAYWEEANGHPDMFWFVIGTSLFMVLSMWLFPEAVGKKKKGG